MIIDASQGADSTGKGMTRAKGKKPSSSLLLPSSSNAHVLKSLVVQSTSDPALIQQGMVVSDSDLADESSENSEKKTVRFDDVVIRHMLPCDATSSDTSSDLWYSREELKQHMLDVNGLIQKCRMDQQRLAQRGFKIQYKKGQPPRPELRGVEELVSPTEYRCLQMRRRQVIKGISNMQRSESCTPYLLAAHSREVSTISQQLAIQKARCDAETVS